MKFIHPIITIIIITVQYDYYRCYNLIFLWYKKILQGLRSLARPALLGAPSHFQDVAEQILLPPKIVVVVVVVVGVVVVVVVVEVVVVVVVAVVVVVVYTFLPCRSFTLIRCIDIHVLSMCYSVIPAHVGGTEKKKIAVLEKFRSAQIF